MAVVQDTDAPGITHTTRAFFGSGGLVYGVVQNAHYFVTCRLPTTNCRNAIGMSFIVSTEKRSKPKVRYTPDSRRQTADGRRQTADGRQQTADPKENKMKALATLAAAAVVLATSIASAEHHEAIESAIGNSNRAEANSERDDERKPDQVLEFVGLNVGDN